MGHIAYLINNSQIKLAPQGHKLFGQWSCNSWTLRTFCKMIILLSNPILCTCSLQEDLNTFEKSTINFKLVFGPRIIQVPRSEQLTVNILSKCLDILCKLNTICYNRWVFFRVLWKFSMQYKIPKCDPNLHNYISP